jgi:nucleoside-diphosphate-sugar epimerase
MKALITGANGFLGAALVRRLLQPGGADLRCFVRAGSRHAHLEALQGAHPDSRLELFSGSLAQTESILPALDGVDVVYHLAAGTSGAAADLFLNSVVASKHLLDAIVLRGTRVKVVLASSFSVYGVAGLKRGTLIDEQTPLESCPEKRDGYAHSKLRQEKLFREYQRRFGFPLTVLRPGVIYGPGGTALSNRVGLRLPGLYLHLGGGNIMPLTYVENCADAIALAGSSPGAEGETYNVHDDDLPTCGQYLRRYRREVERLRCVRLPYMLTRMLSWAVEQYSLRSKGQLPAFLTPYRTASIWKGMRYSNAKLKSLGWRPLIPTAEGLRRTFEHFKSARSEAADQASSRKFPSPSPQNPSPQLAANGPIAHTPV